MVTGIELNLSSIVLKVDGYQKLTATVLPSNAANTKVVWSSSDDNVAEITSSGGVVAVGLGTCTTTCEDTDGSDIKATCEVIVSRDESGTINGQSYVDLFLPSRTLWATCNIGASSPEDYGDYFAWGETEGYNDGKTNFNWITYKWGNGSSDSLTKYNTRSNYGVIDNKTELDLEDDAAYVNWGAEWHMPSLEQFRELINSSYTTTEWMTQNGVIGLKITSKTNGNSIFLPAAGFREFKLFDAGLCCSYWSRTLYTSSPLNACDLYCNSSDVSMGSSFRLYGRSIRPVRLLE